MLMPVFAPVCPRVIGGAIAGFGNTITPAAGRYRTEFRNNA